MKKISISLLAATVISVSAFSQVKFGVQTGGHLSFLTTKYDGEKADGSKAQFGFKLGGVAEIGISDNISFVPELNFIMKGGKSKTTDITNVLGIKTTSVSNESYKPAFIEIPLNITYNRTSESGSGFFGGLGPVISLGLGGKADLEYSTTIETSGFPTQTTITSGKADIKFDGKSDATDGKVHFNGFEFGGNVFAGYRLSNGLFAKATYNMGFSNLTPEDKVSVKSSYFGISIGYLFGQSK